MKPLNQFYISKEGYRQKRCRPCKAERSRRWLSEHPGYAQRYYAENREFHQARGRKYYAEHRDDRIAYTRRYNAEHPEESAAAIRRSVKRWKAAYPERYRIIHRASQIVRRAVAKGKLIPAVACEDCGVTSVKLSGAHFDYSRPLDVKWLCRSCHTVWDHADPKTRNL